MFEVVFFASGPVVETIDFAVLMDKGVTEMRADEASGAGNEGGGKVRGRFSLVSGFGFFGRHTNESHRSGRLLTSCYWIIASRASNICGKKAEINSGKNRPRIRDIWIIHN
jgi:hypothetical protein